MWMPAPLAFGAEPLPMQPNPTLRLAAGLTWLNGTRAPGRRCIGQSGSAGQARPLAAPQNKF